MPNFNELSTNEKKKIIAIVKYCDTHDFDDAKKKISKIRLSNGNKIGNDNALRFIKRYKRCRNIH